MNSCSKDGLRITWYGFIAFLLWLSNGLVVGFLHPEGLEIISRDKFVFSVTLVLKVFYFEVTAPTVPVSSMIPVKVDRNRELIERFLAGERAVDLAGAFGISVRRVNRIVRRYLDRNDKWADRHRDVVHGVWHDHSQRSTFDLTRWRILWSVSWYYALIMV